MPTICLNMIVKNEEKVIKRLLESIIDIIDFFIIIDTGSTDNTIPIIQEYFKSFNISGFILKSEFRDFEFNRNEALQFCYKLSNTDYILLLDADMVLEINNFSKDSLNKDMYYILQFDNNYMYKNTRIIRNKDIFFYKGLTHEVVLARKNVTYETFPRDNICIKDIGDGGCKEDKIDRDTKLLIKSIKEEPDNSRNYFYLANTFFTKRDFDKSEKCYIKRISMGGWGEEIWYSYYRLGLMYLLKKDHIKSLYFFLEAYEHSPNRVENLYYLMNFYRINDKKNIFLHYYNLAKNILEKDIDRKGYLFMEKDMYEIKINQEYEFFIKKNELLSC